MIKRFTTCRVRSAPTGSRCLVQTKETRSGKIQGACPTMGLTVPTPGPRRALGVGNGPVDRKVMTSARLEKMWTVDELAGVSAASVYHWRVQGKRPKAIKIGSCLSLSGGRVSEVAGRTWQRGGLRWFGARLHWAPGARSGYTHVAITAKEGRHIGRRQPSTATSRGRQGRWTGGDNLPPTRGTD